jgi:FkbM family methyltransferase
MQKIGEYWVPDNDAAPGRNLSRTRASFEHGRGAQIAHLEQALRHVAQFDLAIDGGANIGSWSRFLAQRFAVTHAFEPNPDAFACLARNLDDWNLTRLVTAHALALSDKPERVAIAPRRPGLRSVSSVVAGPGDIQAITLDSLELQACSFLKLDLEGYEHRALLGARRTIAMHRPWILIENEAEHNAAYGAPDAAEALLREFGYDLVERYGARQIDWLFRPPKA